MGQDSTNPRSYHEAVEKLIALNRQLLEATGKLLEAFESLKRELEAYVREEDEDEDWQSDEFGDR